MKKHSMRILTFVMLFVLMGNCYYSDMPVVQGKETQDLISGTITVMGNIGEETMGKYIEGFRQKYPAVTVQYHYSADYETEMKTRLENNDYGDVFMVPSFLQSKDYSKYLEPFGDYGTLSEKYRFLEEYRTSFNKIYKLPSSAYIAGIAYNKDVFYKAGITEIPRTTEEFLDALEAISQRTDAIPFYTNYSDDWALQSWWEIFPYIEMTGDANYRENEFVDIAEPFREGRPHYQVYKLLYDILDRGLAGEKPLETNWVKSREMLNSGEIGCMAIGSWALSQFKNAGVNSDSVAFMPFPNEIDGKQYMTICTDYCYGINRNSENKAASRAYVDYMMDESGYALDQECFSLVKTDPYPEAYGDMDDAVLLSNIPSVGENYNKKKKLSANLNLDDPALAKRIMEAAAGAREETFESIMEEWNQKWESGRTWEAKETEEKVEASSDSVISISENYEVDFSDTEKQYLREKTGLKIGYLKNMAPFQFEQEGLFEGVASKVCDVITQETGLQAEYFCYDNTTQMLEALKRGEIEMIAGMEKSEGYEDIVSFSKGYLEYTQVMIKNETVDANMVQQGKMAAVAGENMQSDTEEKPSVEKKTLAEAIKCVEQMEADYTVTNYYSASYYIGQQEFEHVVMLPLTEKGMQYFAFSKEVDTRLISVCNKCIYSIPDINMQMMMLDYMDPEAEEVTLRRFIEANPFQAMLVLTAVLVLIMTAILIVLKEKEKSARKHEIDMKRYEILSTLMDEYIFEYDINKKILHLDKKVSEYFGFGGDISVDEYAGDNVQLKRLIDQVKCKAQNEEAVLEPFRMENADGEVFWYELVAYILRDRYGEPRNLIGKIICVQKEMEEKQQMKKKAQTDPLTDIYNRDGFGERFAELYAGEKTVCPITFAVLDVDNFKQVNDTLGHSGGDEVLKLLADNLKKICAPKSIVARYGGDEFIFLLWETDRQEAEEITNRLVESMDRTIERQGKEQKISISLGAVYTEQRLPYDELFAKADETLYHMKKKGKNGYLIAEN